MLEENWKSKIAMKKLSKNSAGMEAYKSLELTPKILDLVSGMMIII